MSFKCAACAPHTPTVSHLLLALGFAGSALLLLKFVEHGPIDIMLKPFNFQGVDDLLPRVCRSVPFDLHADELRSHPCTCAWALALCTLIVAPLGLFWWKQPGAKSNLVDPSPKK